MKANAFELPVSGFFHIPGVNRLLNRVKKAFPEVWIEKHPNRKSLELIFSESHSAKEILDTVDDVLGLVLTKEQRQKQCSVCGIGLIYGWKKLCLHCEQNHEEYKFLSESKPLFPPLGDELDSLRLDEYSQLEHSLERLSKEAEKSVLELPYGKSQGALNERQILSILRFAEEEYGANFRVTRESVIITVNQGGVDEIDLLRAL